MEAVSFGRVPASRLKEAVDEFLDLDKDPRKYLIGNGKIPTGVNDRGGVKPEPVSE